MCVEDDWKKRTILRMGFLGRIVKELAELSPAIWFNLSDDDKAFLDVLCQEEELAARDIDERSGLLDCGKSGSDTAGDR